MFALDPLRVLDYFNYLVIYALICIDLFRWMRSCMQLGRRKERDDALFGGGTDALSSWTTVVFPGSLFAKRLQLIPPILYLFSDYFWIGMLEFTFVLLNVTAPVRWDHLECWFCCVLCWIYLPLCAMQSCGAIFVCIRFYPSDRYSFCWMTPGTWCCLYKTNNLTSVRHQETITSSSGVILQKP